MSRHQPPRERDAFESAHSSNGLLTAAEVAALLSVPTSWVYGETRAGRIPHVALGPRYRRYERDVIEAWWRDLRRGPTPYRRYAPGCEPGGSSPS